MKIFLCSLTSWGKYCFLQVSHKRKIDCQIDHQGGSCTLSIKPNLSRFDWKQLLNQHWASKHLSFTIITSYSTYKFNTKLKSSTRSSTSYQVSISNNSVFRVGVTLKTKTIKFYTTKLVMAVLHLHEEHIQESYRTHLKYTELSMITFILSLHFQIKNIINFF